MTTKHLIGYNIYNPYLYGWWVGCAEATEKRLRDAEARLAAVDALHQPDLDWPHSSHENPEVMCFRCEYCACRRRRPCPTHLAVHPECAVNCQHIGGAAETSSRSDTDGV